MEQKVISSKRTDLLLEHGEKQIIQPTVQNTNIPRKEELAQKQLDLETQQDILKKELSTIEREIKGINLFESGRVEILDDDAGMVQSQNGQKEYLVNSKEGTCQCKDHEHRGKDGIICMHRIAEKLERVNYNLKKQTPKKETNGITFASMCN